MLVFVAAGAAAWLGCAGDDGSPPPPETAAETGGPDTVPLGDDEGSLVVLSWQASAIDPEARTLLLGMFGESREGVVNLAQCVGSADGFCAEALPAKPGDSVVVTSLDPALLDRLTTVEVGSEIRIGPWVAPYAFDSQNGLGFYYSRADGADLPDEPVALALDGPFAVYDQESVPVPTPIQVTAPDPSREFDLYETAPLDLRWTPGGDGQVFLVVSTPAERRLFLLEDDGQEPVDLSPLKLADGALVDLILGRWTVTTLDHAGHDLNVQIQSNQQLRGTWRTTGPRVELTELYDECAAASAAPGVAPGVYTGSLAGAGRDLDPALGGCTGRPAGGPDALVPIDLLPDDVLTVNYHLVADNASLYLVTDCENPGTCLVGADQGQAGTVEQVVYHNATGSPQRVYAVLDAVGQVTDRFDLDIFVEALGGDVLVPTCIEAMDQGPIGSGLYRGSLAVHADLLDPECAAPVGGGEGLLQLYLEPGASVRATATTPGGDAKMYLMYHCAIVDSCFYADADEPGITESLTYVNTTGVAEYVYLVVDSDGSLGDYLLDMTVQ